MSRGKSRMSANAKWAIALLLEIIILVSMGLGYAVFYVKYSYREEVQVDEHFEENIKESINEDANVDQKGYKTIALFGIDSRDSNNMKEGNRSDSIIIASINNDTKEVKLVSVYRDTLLQVDYNGGVTTKITHAYAYGGPEMAVRALNANLDLQITDYVTVNFAALAQVIDELGGITIDVREAELPMLNACITEQMAISGVYSDGVFTTGEQLLNGTQATGWARIRSTDQGDITRTERQRTVIAKIIAKAKTAGVDKVINTMHIVFPKVCTSIDEDEMMDLAKSLMSYQLGDTLGFPMAYAPVNHETKGAILVPADLTSNVSALHQFLFGTENYQPTSTVTNISSQITNETGVGSQQIDINVFNPPDNY